MKAAILTATPEAVLHVASRMREEDRAEIFATRWSESPLDLAEDCVRLPGVSWVAWGEGVGPVAVYGAVPMWPGVWNVWLFATDHFQPVGLEVTRHIRRVMMPYLVMAGAHRAETRSSMSHVKAHKWLEHLGARREAVLRDFGRNKEDFLLFSWTLESV